MDFADAQAYLDAHIDVEKTTGISAGHVEGLSLDRMRRVVEVLGDPQRDYPVIHITGTNGKGSTARMVTALLAAHQLSVGTYTSPHLEHVTERISRNGEPIAVDELAGVVGEIAALEDQGLLGDPPSYFELLTAAAFAWFSQEAVDVAVVEVGLLGRYDATNVADGQVAVVTNVGKDHTDGTGDWRRRVAEEKAGIVKPGSHLVLGETDPDLRAVFTGAGATTTDTDAPGATGADAARHAAAQIDAAGNGAAGTGAVGNGAAGTGAVGDGAAGTDTAGDGAAEIGAVRHVAGGTVAGHGDEMPARPDTVWVRDDDFGVMTDRVALGGHVIDLRTPFGEHDEVFLPVHGSHQADNAAAAVAAVEAFFGRALDPEVVTEAFAGLRLPGRFEVVHRAPLLVLDGAHNPDGAAAAADTLADEFDIAGTRRWVLGLLGGRDLDEVLDAFGVRPGDQVIATTPPSPRGVPAGELASLVAAREIDVVAVPEVARAVERAWRAAEQAGEGDLVLVTGSLYTVGAARTACRHLRLLT